MRIHENHHEGLHLNQLNLTFPQLSYFLIDNFVPLSLYCNNANLNITHIGSRIKFLLFLSVITESTNLYNAVNLDPNTTYRWRVQGLCEQSGSNNSGFTAFRYFTTISSSRIIGFDVLVFFMA